ncbi:U-box domain-containing protein 38-like [Dorcoceras hygrometricum]|uniref:RING-type E3 ubiquitin transferase n=1 Tax=Dorcoceras hygrometricum TaxID=472368 RepID=A0A2Z7B9R1_9LAMI|nr:U-box domain-containing protein 38-like [Dorcoceras hygrometricum]
MGGDGKPRRWRISFHGPCSAAAAVPPSEFVCPISKSLMFDPNIVSSGQTFERVSVQVCNDLGFIPTLPDGSKPDLSTVIPNLALKAAIQNWCSKSGWSRPNPPIYSDIESIICSSMGSSTSKNRVSDGELLEGVSEIPQVSSSHAATEPNSRNFSTSSSSDDSVTTGSSPISQFKTRPSCFSTSSSSWPSTSSDFIPDEASFNDVSARSSTSSPAEDENFVNKIQSSDVFDREQALIWVRETTKTDEESRATLCTDKLLSALKLALISPFATLKTNAAATLVNLSIEKRNKIKIVRAGIVPLLIDVLRNGSDESKEHAAGAIFSLAIENENRTTIGVLGALQPLMHAIRSGSQRCRLDSASALYHLTLVQTNIVKIVKLGAVGVLLGLLKDPELAARVILVLGNLAACEPGRTALLEAGGVGSLLEVLRKGIAEASVSTRENCVTTLYLLSFGSLRFKAFARDAGAAEVLEEVAETGSELVREQSWKILEGLRPREEAEEVDWDAVMKGGVGHAGYRAGRGHGHGPGSTEF